MSYVDLHLHLLPGVDDGPADEAASLDHARRMSAEGVREATVTPHVGHPSWPVDVTTIHARTAALQARLRAQGIPLVLHPGGEIHPSAASSLTADQLGVVAHGPPGARWVLLEVPFGGIDDAFLAGCRAIREHGFGVVIAHPERARGFAGDGLEALRGEMAAGAVLQVNVCSLLGHNGEEAEWSARRLVRGGAAYLLASDGHGGRRGHTLRLGFELALAAGVTSERAWRLTQANPRFLLRHGLPAGPRPEERVARPWRARPERAMAAARRALVARSG